MSQSALYSEQQALLANLTLERLGVLSWEASQLMPVQRKVKAKPVDGWFGPKSIKAWKAWAKKHDAKPAHLHDEQQSTRKGPSGSVIIGGVSHQPPPGVKVVSFLDEGGIPAELDDTSRRKIDPYQFVIHRGAERKRKSEANYAVATERVLDARGLSTTFSQDIDGTIYQHFDPAARRGRHASYHNPQSDSIDIGGPFSQKVPPMPGQEKLTLKMAIGRKNDGKPPLTRRAGTVRCWTMTTEQIENLAGFIPWYCKLRGIPVTACEDWRTFRLSGKLGTRDPVTKVKGILSHTNISNPGARVDGVLPMYHLKEYGADIQWRSGADFFNV